MSPTPPASIRYLQLLRRNPQGLRLRDFLASQGRTDRKAQAATVTVLLSMRQKERATYEEATGSDRGGLYRATDAGLAYLTRKLQAHPEWADELGEGVLETGAMRGETRTVVHRTAAAVDIPRSVAPAWVFGLGQASASMSLSAA